MTLVNDANFPGLQYITADNIHSPEVSAIFSTKNTGENYRIVMASRGGDFKGPVTSEQKHTDNIVVVDEAAAEKSQRSGSFRLREIADALVTDIKGLLLSVRTADCVPVLLYDSKNRSVGAVHAGWRGTLAGIVPKTVRRMTDVYGSDPKYIKAAIGPAIGLCCFEVGFEVREKFAVEYGESIDRFFTAKPGEKPYGDIKSMNREFLIEAGIPEKNIEMSDLCTKCNTDLFFSFRRSGEKCGSMASFIGLK